jgi:hypothetical protein
MGSLGPYAYILGVALVVGIVGLIITEIEKRRKKRTPVHSFTATVKRGSDGTFTAVAVIGEHTVIGEGATKDAAIADLRRGAKALFDYLKSTGQPLPEVAIVEVVIST